MQQLFSKTQVLIVVLILVGITSTSFANAKNSSRNSAVNTLSNILIKQAEKQSLNLVISPDIHLKHPVYLNDTIGNFRDNAQLFKLNNILNTLHIHAIFSQNTLSLIPLNELKNMPGKIYHAGSIIQDSEWAYASFKVDKKVCVEKLVPMLRTLMPRHAHLARNDQQNLMIIFDRKGNIEKIQALIKSIEAQVNKDQAPCNLQFKVVNGVSTKRS
jgi:hypothetical protein